MGRSEEVDQRLVTLGLIHFTELGHMPLDRSLIQGLAMFWRPETHTFHFSRVGEMTVTLEDVVFILGLPTTGRAVTGRTDYDDLLLLADLALPRDTPMEVLDCFREWAKEGRLKKDEPGTEDVDRIDRYTRALVLELIGCELFPDATGDSGAATLTMLYRGLDNAAMGNGGQKALAPSKKIKGPYHSDIEYTRDVLLKMDHGHVVWRPYEEEVKDVVMPSYARIQMRLYYLRGRDLQDLFPVKLAMWTHTTQVQVAEVRPWSDEVLPSYDRWMRVHGCAYLVPIPGAAEQIPARELTYLQETPDHVSMVKHILTKALRACAWAVKKGCRRTGKQLLKSCSTQLDLVGEPHRLPHLLEAKGLPTDINAIPDLPEEDHMPEPGFEEQQFMRVYVTTLFN
ncbi:hypothetical protein LUZ63_000433 [Rhynchospora breviuscula]|uniref:Aminotransferase-like plant mobile domain-containing protein n=1 Tax=Rhynchospora breviuscula TaxID=2022672 RepID=A0A9Q0CWB6_9POAL|nr:hypothetical protein LUZ63_000433 [Rhynchospora breviuscula]